MCFRACSYDPAYRDVSLTETNISVRSYGIFRPACRDEIRDKSLLMPGRGPEEIFMNSQNFS